MQVRVPSIRASDAWSKLFLAASKETASTKPSGLGRAGLGQEGIRPRCREPGSVKQSPHRVLACRAALGTCLISVLPASQILTLHHFDSSFSAFQPAQWQRQCCSSFRFAWLFSVPCGCLVAVPSHGAALTSGAQPSSQRAELPQQVWPCLLRWCQIHFVIDPGLGHFSSAGSSGVLCPVEIVALLLGSAACLGEWDLYALLRRLIKEYGKIHCLPRLRGL